MAASLGIGVLLVILGGCMEGVYVVPMKFAHRWRWEQMWGAGSFFALLLVGWPVALLTIPNLASVFAEAGWHSLVAPALYGLAWGAGGVFFGLGVEIVGVGVGVSLILGLLAIVGTIVPLVLYRREQFGQASGQLLMVALVIMLAGILLCGRAGSLRAKASATLDSSASVRGSYWLGLTYCVLSGVLSPMVNFALLKGDFLRQIAIRHGASPVWAVNAIWSLVFTVAYGLNVAYCLVLIFKNRTLSRQVNHGTWNHWAMAAAMGILWAGGIVFYGVGATYMGHLGAYAGWPLQLIFAIGTSTAAGFFLGEWRGAGPGAIRIMSLSLALLLVAAVLLGWVNRLSA
jgi:L-rhamnose-H+ transport protein